VRTRIAVVGAGPAGLVLSNVLHQAGIEHRVLERRTREEVENTPRAGLVEHRVVEYLRRQGLADHLLVEGTQHGWCDVVCGGERFRLDYDGLTGGDRHWIYPQQLLLRDLLGELDKLDRAPDFETPVERVQLRPGTGAVVHGPGFELDCDYVIGCDGAQSAVAECFPAAASSNVQHRHPYDWITILADLTAPVEGIRYAIHENGFAGMMPRAGSFGRLYLQAPADDDLARWPEERLRAELDLRLGVDAQRPGVERLREVDVLRMRSGIARSLRWGSALLAGDAAHVLTPSGAKGMNLAIADAADLAESLVRRYRDRDGTALASYGSRRRAHARRILGFSEELLGLLHLPPESADPAGELEARRRRVRELAGSGPEAERFAREYVGSGELPMPAPARERSTPWRS